ncbi:MAG: hypothetical protein WD688_01735 [Candidatus Binatia bacterium]
MFFTIVALFCATDAHAQQSCDGLVLTVTGRIAKVTFYSKNNEFGIDTADARCGEVSITGNGRPPRECVVGRTISATGQLEDALLADYYEMWRPRRLSCY